MFFLVMSKLLQNKKMLVEWLMKAGFGNKNSTLFVLYFFLSYNIIFKVIMILIKPFYTTLFHTHQNSAFTFFDSVLE